jgi:acetylornithine deacetylase/succinyl-diaminopimelate desuccinylase-like protein
MVAPSAVIEAIDQRFEATVRELMELSRIPSVSAAGFDPKEVERSAAAVATLLEEAGFEGVEILRVGEAHPYVVAERAAAGPGAADAPTVLIYAHHDVQPPGRPERWVTPAFEPTVRDDGRLYGRGVVDDKAGLMLHVAALRGWIETESGPPVNVKLIVEGEEEIGSGHLAAFLEAHRERLACDVLVLSDTANIATGVPSMTTSLRGIVQIDVTVAALDHPIHSGMWGGPVPDAATALSRILGRLFDDDGLPAVPGLEDDVPEVTDAERAELAALPFDPEVYRSEAGMLEGVALRASGGADLYERLWWRPALSVVALEAMPLAEATNQLVAEARARVSVRVAPGQDAERVARCVVASIEQEPPAGVRVRCDVTAAVPGWKRGSETEVLEAACRALAEGYGVPATLIGCGATIPFVGPFGEVMGGIPELLLGLEDPPCNAHGENESLDLADFRKAAHASAHLLAELKTTLAEKR